MGHGSLGIAPSIRGVSQEPCPSLFGKNTLIFPLTAYTYLLSFLSSLRGGLTEGEVRRSNLLDYRGDCFALAGLAMTLMPNT